MTQRFEIHPDVSRASTLPGSFYHSQDIYDELTEKVLGRSWHFLGHRDQFLAERSHATPIELLPGSLDEPLVLTSDENGRPHVLSNVCTHRANVVMTKAGSCKGLRCGYHGRRFGLDGRCASSPEFQDVADFPGPAENLTKLGLERLGPFLFTTLGAQFGFDEWMGPLRALLGGLPSEPYVFDAEGSADYQVGAHWALYVDNFLEGFHIPFVHPELNKLLETSSYTTELQPWSNVQLGEGRPGDPCFTSERLPRSDEGGEEGQGLAALYAWLFPNLMLNFYPWGLSVNVVEPQGLGSTRVRFLRYVARPELLGRGAGGDLDGVQREDEQIVEAVQRGTRSRLYRSGRFSPHSERGVHQFHSLLAKSLDG